MYKLFNLMSKVKEILLENGINSFTSFEELVALLPEELQNRLEQLKSNPERLDYHPEGNTYDHIKIVTERLMTTGDMDLIMAAVFHDLGKLETTKPHPKTGQPCAFGHERVSGNLVNQYSDFIVSMGANPKTVHEIVVNHMRVKQIPQMGKKKQGQIQALATFKKLEIFAKADSMLKNF